MHPHPPPNLTTSIHARQRTTTATNDPARGSTKKTANAHLHDDGGGGNLLGGNGN